MNSKFFRNVVTGFGGQFITIILGLIVPRLIIKGYGSDVNGLLSTITQIFTYLALLEAGIGAAAKNALYKPISCNNKDEISNILSAANNYFRKLSYLYIGGVISLAVVLPIVLATKVSYFTVFFIVIFEGLSGAISFLFCQTPTILLAVDGKNYINNGITLLNKTLGYLVKIIMANMGMNIVTVQIAYFAVTILKAFLYQIYLRKRYRWLKLKNKSSFNLSDRNSYLISEITWTIFSSTDMIVLSVFLNTEASSVYGVYNMIFSSLNLLLNSVYLSINYKLGYEYHVSLDKYKKMHDLFNSVFVGAITVLMSVAYILCIPFVTLYTSGVSDINYCIRELPLMFSLVQMLSWSRFIGGNLIGVAGRQKQAVPLNVIEASINLIFSIILVNKFGIVGVLVATVIALPVKLIYCNIVSDCIILKRSMKNTIKILTVNFVAFLTVVFANNYISLNINNYFSFLVYAIFLTIVMLIIIIFVNCLANNDLLQILKKGD